MGKVTFLDFFSGIGGFRMGFENAGMKCMGHVEWDKYAQQSYKAIYGDREGYGEEYCGWDIREVRAADLPRVDVWTFGAPCQDFSIAGQRKGMDGDRSSLIREVFRLIEESEHKPERLVYENVKGMLSSNRGWDFFGILFEMDKLGYDTEWQIFNSKDWGVPQNRERVYTIGHFRRCGGRKVLPITGQGGETGGEISSQSGINVIGNVGKTGHGGFNVYSAGSICPTLKAVDYKNPVMVAIDDQGGGNESAKIAIPVSSPDFTTKNQNGRRFKEDGEPMFTLTAQDRHGVAIRETADGFHLCRNNAKKSSIQGTHVTYPEGTSHCLTSAHTPMTIDQRYIDGMSDEYSFAKKKAQAMLNEKGELPERFNPYNAQEIDEVSPTLTANCDRSTSSSTVLMKQPNFRIRKLTPLECWRLQGFPDWAFYRAKEAGVSDSQLYKQAGNSVTVNVTEVIGRAIVE